MACGIHKAARLEVQLVQPGLVVYTRLRRDLATLHALSEHCGAGDGESGWVGGWLAGAHSAGDGDTCAEGQLERKCVNNGSELLLLDTASRTWADAAGDGGEGG